MAYPPNLKKEIGIDMVSEVSKVIAVFASKNINPNELINLIPKVYVEFKKIFDDASKISMK